MQHLARSWWWWGALKAETEYNLWQIVIRISKACSALHTHPPICSTNNGGGEGVERWRQVTLRRNILNQGTEEGNDREHWRGSEGLSGHITPRPFPSSLPVPGLWELPSFISQATYFAMLSMFPRKLFQVPLESCNFLTEVTYFELRSFVCMPSCLTCSKVNSLREVCSLLSPSSSAQHRNWACSRYFYYYCCCYYCYYYYFTLWLQDEYLHRWYDAWYAINEESYILWVLSTRYPGVKLFASMNYEHIEPLVIYPWGLKCCVWSLDVTKNKVIFSITFKLTTKLLNFNF